MNTRFKNLFTQSLGTDIQFQLYLRTTDRIAQVPGVSEKDYTFVRKYQKKASDKFGVNI